VVPSPSIYWHVLANFDEPAKATATKGRSPKALRKSIVTVIGLELLNWWMMASDDVGKTLGLEQEQAYYIARISMPSPGGITSHESRTLNTWAPET
jgi:hypothetical protein